MTARLAVSLAAALAAAALAVLAVGAFAVEREVSGGGRATGTPARAAGALVGLRTQHALADALLLLRERGGTLAERLRHREEAASVLGRLAAGGDARAANLLGVLSVAQARADRLRAAQTLGDAKAAFTAAIDANPQDEDAKYNLELLLAQGRQQMKQQAQKRPGDRRKGRSSNRPAGSGY